MTSYSVAYIHAVMFDLNNPRPDIKARAISQAKEILKNLGDAKQAANEKKKAYHATKKKN